MLLFAAAYLIMIRFLQWYMHTQPRYEIRTFLFVWNYTLATFSICGTARMLPEFVHSLQNGIYYSVCVPRCMVCESLC